MLSQIFNLTLQEEKQIKVEQEVQLWMEKKQVQLKVQKKMENQRKKTEQVLLQLVVSIS